MMARGRQATRASARYVAARRQDPAQIDGAVSRPAWPRREKGRRHHVETGYDPLSDAPPDRRIIDVRTEIGNPHPPSWRGIACQAAVCRFLPGADLAYREMPHRRVAVCRHTSPPDPFRPRANSGCGQWLLLARQCDQPNCATARRRRRRKNPGIGGRTEGAGAQRQRHLPVPDRAYARSWRAPRRCRARTHSRRRRCARAGRAAIVGDPSTGTPIASASLTTSSAFDARRMSARDEPSTRAILLVEVAEFLDGAR